MASSKKNLSKYKKSKMPSATGKKFAIVVSEWHPKITEALRKGCYETLIELGASADDIHTHQVPGAFELPLAARMSLGKHQADAVIALGCVIKGDTDHNEYINQAVSLGLTQLSIMSGIPCVYGVLTPNNEEQALDRAGGKYGNKGVEAAVTAVKMADMRSDLKAAGSKIGF